MFKYQRQTERQSVCEGLVDSVEEAGKKDNFIAALRLQLVVQVHVVSKGIVRSVRCRRGAISKINDFP